MEAERETSFNTENCGIDWLTGKYTGKKERLRRELERLERGDAWI